MKASILLIILMICQHLIYSQELLADLDEEYEDEYVTIMDIPEENPELKDFVEEYLSYHPDKYNYISCNENNVFYENDTVRMQQISKDYYPVWECCTFVEWRLVNDVEFLWSDLETCERKIDRSYYLSVTRVNAYEENNSIYLEIIRDGTIVDHFRVIDVEEKPSRHSEEANNVLVLYREEQDH